MKEKVYELLSILNCDGDFESSTDFLADELLDSFNVIELVSLLESEFEIKIPGMDIVPENFANIDDIIKLIEKNQK